MTGTTLSVSAHATLPLGTQGFTDFGTCPSTPLGQGTLASLDTAYYCASATTPATPAPVSVSVTGVGPFSWAVVSGAASLSATTGPSVTVTPAATATAAIRVRVTGSATTCGQPAPADTVTLLPVTATLDAGPHKVFPNCGGATTTLSATVTGTTPGVSYTYAWSPTTGILSGANTLTPTINPLSSIGYTFSATTPAAQGGCVFTDTVGVTVTPAAAPFTLTATRDSLYCEPVYPFYTLFAQPLPAAGYYRYQWSGAPIIGPTNVATPTPLTTTGTRTWYVEVRDSFGCHTRRDTVTLSFRNLTASVSPLKADFCPGDTIVLRAEGSPNGRWAYAWSPTTGLVCPTCPVTIARPRVTTLYAATLTDTPSGCQLYRTANLTSYAYPDSFSAGPDRVVRPTPGSRLAEFTLEGKAAASSQFVGWNPAEPLDDPFSARTAGKVDSTTVFVLSAANGPCVTRDTAIVYYVSCAGARMPNIFSPNGDRVNDVFTLANRGSAAESQVVVRRFRVFNRWGTLVYSEGSGGGGGANPGILTGWDGTMNGEPQPVGAYVWTLEGECTDGATGETTLLQEEGTVTLVR